jgi:phage shock protein PspC (stress-responsive transcriptional regulator)
MKLFLIFICLALAQLTLQQTDCSSNLECSQTACCRDGKCVEFDICIADIRNIYIAIGIVGFLFLIVIFIYFIWSISQTRKNVKKLRDQMNAVTKKAPAN